MEDCWTLLTYLWLTYCISLSISQYLQYSVSFLHKVYWPFCWAVLVTVSSSTYQPVFWTRTINPLSTDKRSYVLQSWENLVTSGCRLILDTIKLSNFGTVLCIRSGDEWKCTGLMIPAVCLHNSRSVVNLTERRHKNDQSNFGQTVHFLWWWSDLTHYHRHMSLLYAGMWSTLQMKLWSETSLTTQTFSVKMYKVFYLLMTRKVFGNSI